MRPDVGVGGRVEQLREALDDLSLALPDEHVCPSDGADIQRLIARIQDQDLLQLVQNVPTKRVGDLPRYRDIARSTASSSSGESATDARPRVSSFT